MEYAVFPGQQYQRNNHYRLKCVDLLYTRVLSSVIHIFQYKNVPNLNSTHTVVLIFFLVSGF